MATVTSSNNASLSPANVFYQKVPLKRLIAKTVFYQLSYKKSLVDNMGNTYSWVLGGVQAADTNPVVQGMPVVPTNVSSQTITAAVQQYGNAVSASDFVGDTSVVDAEKFLLEQIEQKGAYTIDALLRNEVFGTCTTFGTNLYAANSKSSVAALGTTDILTLADLRRGHSLLENNNVPTFRDGKMAAVISVAQKYDVTNSNAGGGFLDLAKQNPTGIAELQRSEDITEDGEVESVGEYAGLVIFATSLTPVINNGTTNVHYSAMWGDESLGAVELEAEKFKIFRKKPNDGVYDIIDQIKLAMGYKVTFAAKNLSQDLTTQANQRVISIASATSLL